MDTSFKTRSFKFIYWIMLILLAGDTLDTIYRSVSGYFGGGISVPGVDAVLQPTGVDMIIFLIVQCGVVYGIYLLYKLKKIGGYWFLGSNIVFLIYVSIFGPIAEIGISAILPMLILYLFIYVILAICVPLYYSDKFE